jgi:hypothetical protein
LTKPKDSKDIRGKSEKEILLKISCMISTYRFLEKKSEEKKSEKKTTGPKEKSGEEVSKNRKK